MKYAKGLGGEGRETRAQDKHRRRGQRRRRQKEKKKKIHATLAWLAHGGPTRRPPGPLSVPLPVCRSVDHLSFHYKYLTGTHAVELAMLYHHDLLLINICSPRRRIWPFIYAGVTYEPAVPLHAVTLMCLKTGRRGSLGTGLVVGNESGGNSWEYKNGAEHRCWGSGSNKLQGHSVCVGFDESTDFACPVCPITASVHILSMIQTPLDIFLTLVLILLGALRHRSNHCADLTCEWFVFFFVVE